MIGCSRPPTLTESPGGLASGPTQLLYATSVTGEIGSTQTTVTALRVEADGSLTSLGTAFTLGPGVTTWETLSLRTSDVTGHHVFGIESVSLLEAPFSTTYSLITFTVQPDTGTLQQTSSLTLPDEPTTLALSPDGTLMFVGLFAESQTAIATYSVDSSGSLTLTHTVMPGFQFAVYATVVNPAGTYLYTIGGGAHGYGLGVQFAMDSTGVLTPVGSSRQRGHRSSWCSGFRFGRPADDAQWGHALLTGGRLRQRSR